MRRTWRELSDGRTAVPGSDPLWARFNGTEANDTYFGTSRADRVFGFGGNDTLTGADGNDVIDGGEGHDILAGDAGDDSLNGGAGNDLLSSSSGADRVDGGEGKDLWFGVYQSSPDTITFDEGGLGDDVLNGGSGDDVIDGSNGSDTAGYFGATSGVVVTVADGPQDTKGAGIDTLNLIENINGSTFGDILTGNFFDNALRGFDGGDVVRGLDGDDWLDGGKGVDRLIGGTGSDVFAFGSSDDFGQGVRDKILDFSNAEGDRIDLSAIDQDSARQGDQAFTFIGSAGFSGDAVRYELRVRDAGNGTWLVSGDLNQDRTADFTISVFTVAPLVAGDFSL